MRWTLLLAVAILMASCSGEGTDPSPASSPVTVPATIVATSTTPPAPTTVPEVSTTTPLLVVPPQLAERRIETIHVAGLELVVAVAEDEVTRARGLMEVEDLGSLDGMLFVWQQDTDSTFWMSDTLIPLDIAWFDAEGRFVSSLTMPVCPPEVTCPHYAADGTYRYAVEVREGEMPHLDDDSLLELFDNR